jgi:LPXTG-motif cell wall-anchored protein
VFDVVFSEPVVGFATGDVMVGGTAGAGQAAVSGGGAAYTVSVTGMQQTGTVVVTIGAGVAVDGAGNPNTASTFTDNSVTWNAPAQPDNTPPAVTIDQAAGQADPTSTSPILFTVVFSEPVTGFATGDVTLGGTAGATSAVVSGGPTTYTVTVTGMQPTGTVTATVAAGVAVDGAGNPNTASTSTDSSVQWNAPPAPLPGGSQTIPTAGGNVTLTYPAGTALQSFTSAAPQVPPPAGVTFPYGQLSFTATAPANGLVTFTLTLPGTVNGFYKLFGQSWLSFTWDGETGAQVNGNVVSITIRDNGRGDSNPAVGVVTDPGAPAVVATQLPGTGTDPLAPLAAGLTLVLAGLAVLHLSRRRRLAA